MPSLQSFAVLDQRVSKYLSDRSLEFAGAAFQWVALETILGLNSFAIEDAIVDEGMDGGIDAIHIEERSVHIFTFTYAQTFHNAGKAFPQGKLDNLLVTVEKIYQRTLREDDVNPALWEKVQAIWNLFGSGVLNFRFYVCSNKEEPNEASKRRFEDGLEPFHFVSFEYWDLEDIVTAIVQARHRPVSGSVTFIDSCHFAKSDGHLKATVATIAASDLIELVKDSDDPEQINDHIFNDNIRVDLGLKNAINRGIYESALSENNFEFWYLNNGITVVCDECEYVPYSRSPTAKLKNFQIVNGGQTTRTLFKAYLEDPEKFRHVDILLRIIETKDRSISERIGETANRQTTVRTRDLHANDWIQRKLEDEFLSIGYYYERKKNQHADKPIEARLDAEEVGQVALAFYLDMPSEAKDQKTIVFGDMYNEIFDEDVTTASRLLFPMLLYKPIDVSKRKIQRRKRRKEPVSDKDAFFSLATFHILNAMNLIAGTEKSDLKDEVVAASARETAVKLIGQVVAREKKALGELYTHDRFFKQKATNLTIREHIKSAYQQH